MTDLLRSVVFHSQTAILFTRSDMKTLLIPVSAFACAVAPVHSVPRLLLGIVWTWCHQLMCNVSNQSWSGSAEDAMNKPWRPLPAGRITQRQARIVRWVTVGICLLLSSYMWLDLLPVTLGLVLTTVVYDELGMSGHYIGKNICNIGGYATIEMGATKLMGVTRDLDSVSMLAVFLSGAVIMTTIQAQDFADVEGDAALGRVTLPIYAPEFSRVLTLCTLVAWSIALSVVWGIGPLYGGIFIALGAYVGWRFYCLRSPADDCWTYVIYNIWLTAAHIMPVHARFGILYL
ncbi:UbiA prenyltransferase family [Daedaleopsis nitida]|nr:UbiA prenyltransferase family [Daedaleopsis nitida]